MPPLFQNLKNLISTEGRIGVQWERPNLDLDFSKDSAFRGPPKMVWSLNAELAVFSGMQSTERRGGLQWKENLLDFII